MDRDSGLFTKIYGEQGTCQDRLSNSFGRKTTKFT